MNDLPGVLASDLQSGLWNSEGDFGDTNLTRKAVQLDGAGTAKFYRLRRQ